MPENYICITSGPAGHFKTRPTAKSFDVLMASYDPAHPKYRPNYFLEEYAQNRYQLFSRNEHDHNLNKKLEIECPKCGAKLEMIKRSADDHALHLFKCPMCDKYGR